MLAAVWVNVTASLAVSSSLSAVTVTVWARSQFEVVKIRVDALRLTSVPARPPTVTVTSCVGSVSSTTV